MSYSDLPYASEILCSCAYTRKEKPHKFSPDPRLQNWEKWMRNRKELNKSMGKRLDRHAEQLLFNYSEDLRSIRQEKMVLENTKIVNPHDPYRGSPAFWTTPISLLKRPCQPDYFSVPTKEQQCEIPSMDYVGVPTAIRYEKSAMTSGYRNPKDVWNKSEYRKQRIEDLSVEIQHVEPHKPNLSELFVKGVAISQEVEVTAKEPSGEDTAAEEKKILAESIHDNEDFLLIDNCKLCPHVTSNIHVYLNFEYDIGSRDLQTKTIPIENGTSYALRYYLNQKKNFFLFRDIAQEMEEQVFFYDKRELIILPNEKIDLPISFKTEYPRTYKMQLEFNTRPKLWEYSFIIHLIGVATYHDLTDKCEQIKKYVDFKANENIVKDTIYDLLNDVPADEPSTPIFYIYDKATIFEAANQNFTPIEQRPKYIYNKEIVEELEHFYSTVRLPNTGPTWNFNIDDLRATTKLRQELDYQNKFVDELLTLKTEEEEKVAASTKSVSKISSKTSKSMKSQELKFGEKSDRSIKISKSGKSQGRLEETKKTIGKNLMVELESILSKLQQSSIWLNENKDLYESCYAVLCTAIDVSMRDITKLEADLLISRNDKYPSQYTYDIRTFVDRKEEVHDDLSGQIPRVQEDFIKESLPIAQCLKDLPFDQCDARHKAYYGIVEEAPPEGKKKGKGKKEKPPKKEKKQKQGKNVKQETSKEPAEELPHPDIDLNENVNFNISEEHSIKTSISIQPSFSSDDGSSELTTGLLQKEYKRSLYDIFYKHLLEATLNFTDVIELYKRKKNKLANIKRMLAEVSSRDPPADIKVLDLKQALRYALELPTKYQAQYSEVKARPEEEPPKYEEPVHLKEIGSEWSILKPLRGPDEIEKPISSPEANVYLKKRLGKRMVKDIGTIMSNAGIHPDWLDFKDIGVQIISQREARPEKEDFVSGIIGDMVNEICMQEAAADSKDEEGEGSTASDEVFYDEDVDDITNKSLK